MNLFGRKDEDENDLIEEGNEFGLEEELRDRKLTRKFKDLAPENKKKRKEPPKPWGKKERFIVLSFFLVTTILATVMFLFSHNLKFPGLPKISFGNINIKNPFAEEVIVIGQKENMENTDQKALKAIDMFKGSIKPLSGLYGFSVVRLSDSYTSYGVSSDIKFQGASILKLPLMVYIYKLSEEEKIDLDTKYTLKEEDKIKGSGILYTEMAGKTFVYKDLIMYMGKNSDRTAYKIMKDIVGTENLKQFVRDIGMEDTNIETGETTPDDISLLFRKLWKKEILNEKNRDELFTFLEKTKYEEWITKDLPSNTRVVHKFGQDLGVIADGGIIFTKNPYVLVLMGEGITSSEADTFYPRISRDIYNIENDVQ